MEDSTEVVRLPIASLKPYNNNAKKHTKEQIEAVANSIREFGFRNPVIAWTNEDGVPEIVAGHARVTAAKKLGLEEVPVILCDDLSDAQRRALTLADNQTTMMTGWDDELLAYELDTLAADFNMGDFGFDLSEFDVETEDDRYTKATEGLIYEPTGEQPAIEELCDTSERDAFTEGIDAMDAPEEVKAFMRLAATRFIRFDYQTIADWYCHATDEEKAMCERLKLVIVDYDDAIAQAAEKLVGRLDVLDV